MHIIFNECHGNCTRYQNKKKIEEIRRILDGLNISLLTLDDFPYCPEVDENADTFEVMLLKRLWKLLNVPARRRSPMIQASRYTPWTGLPESSRRGMLAINPTTLPTTKTA